ncbi:MAG TPA: 1-deoxy-D-xylulose-5-phosphate reductoisomerase [Nitrospiria bacterium]|nr:1-deoxy-D-xylulose-5-phosphate reductoisomerase [Nitrospiria bacterium]
MPRTRVIILGATGSIGRSALDVAAAFPEEFEVTALAAGRGGDAFERQIRAVRPRVASVASAEEAARLRVRCADLPTEILGGPDAAATVAQCVDGDVVVSAIVGAAGLLPTVAAIRAGKTVALANKETMVMAGALVTAEAARRGTEILPVDSEHSAIFQVLAGHRREDVRRLILTASGGPLRDLPSDRLARVTPEDALRHPNWSMGPKITIDSATLMNKGLEVIEAHWLFGVPAERIDVVIHRQSIVHSMVEFCDGAILAQMGVADMRGPIAYAMSHPRRLPLPVAPLDVLGLGALTFEAPDTARFPCLGYAYAALRAGGTMPAALNAANEEAVAAFLDGRIGFLRIAETVDRVLHETSTGPTATVDDVLEADAAARRSARRFLGSNPTEAPVLGNGSLREVRA